MCMCACVRVCVYPNYWCCVIYNRAADAEALAAEILVLKQQVDVCERESESECECDSECECGCGCECELQQCLW